MKKFAYYLAVVFGTAVFAHVDIQPPGNEKERPTSVAEVHAELQSEES